MSAQETAQVAPAQSVRDGELSADAAATLAKLTAVLGQIRQLEQDADTYKQQLRDALGLGAYTINGRPALTISVTRRFDPAHAAKVLPPQWLAAVQRTTVDTKLARELLPPALFTACQVECGKPTVRLP